MTPESAPRLRTRVGVQTEANLDVRLTVAENLRAWAALHAMAQATTERRLAEVLEAVGLADRRDTAVGSLSKGLRQKAKIARALLHEPELLFLDEPTSAVDPESRRDFWEKLFELADRGTTLLVSTHYMDEAERCHRIAILDRGALVADGTPGELTGRLEGRTLLVAAADPRRAQQAIVGVDGVISVAQIGNSLRVLTADGGDAARRRITDALANAGQQARVEAAPASLEDVFVAATHRDNARTGRAA